MDIVGSAAAVVQLIGQAILLWQQVNLARQKVQDAPKLLNEYQEQFAFMKDTARLVKAEKDLQTAEIGEQLKLVEAILQELSDFLGSMRSSEEGNRMKRYLHAIRTGEQNAQDLRRILDRWTRATATLSTRIQLAYVGLARSRHNEVVAIVPTIQRINQRLQELNMRLALAERLEPLLASQRDDNTILLDAGAQKALGINAENLTIQDNSTFDDAAQLNSIAHTENPHVFTTATISRNVVKGSGRQINYIGDPREVERYLQ